jgi:hemolysin III
MKSFLREPINSLTHLIAAIVALPASLYLIHLAVVNANAIDIASYTVYAVSLSLVFITSGVYHGVIASEKVIRILKRIDHLMVFVLIAATYTPTCLNALDPKTRNIMLVTVWVATLIGIIIKTYFIDMPSSLGASIYVVLGCISLFTIFQFKANLAPRAFIFLILGGVSYIVGAVIYAIDYPKRGIYGFKAHEIFHVFVIMGSLFHYLMVYSFIKFRLSN